MLPHQRMVPSFKPPWMTCFEDAQAFDRAWNKGCGLFVPLRPCVVERQKHNGEKYLAVTQTGYIAVQVLSETPGRIYKVGRDPRFKAIYEACCFLCGEEPRNKHYRVDLDHQTCTCNAFEASGKRWCLHLLGICHWLTKPHVVSEKTGRIMWAGGK